LQLYSVDPGILGRAIAALRDEGRVDHIDLNFGCPVKKVTRRGGGAAIPWKRTLFRNLIRAAVAGAGPLPVTVKFRTGIDAKHLTFLDAGRIAADEGCAAVALHARTAAQLYDGAADWSAIAALRDAVRDIPVLGNGDIWEAGDALRMMRETGCDGVVVGRGCLGRPWLFRDLADGFAGRPVQKAPRLREVFATLREHAELLAGWFGEASGIRSARKHAGWYTKGFRGSARLREHLMRMQSLDELDEILSSFPDDEPFPAAAARVPRGKRAGTQRVVLPKGWLEHRDDDEPPGALAEEAFSGG
jgi:nifR3 family TIM-barrel protein